MKFKKKNIDGSPEKEMEFRSVRMTSCFMNDEKYNYALELSKANLKTKQWMSSFIKNNFHSYLLDQDKFLTNYKKFTAVNNEDINAWETQTMFQDVVGFYKNHFKQICQNLSTSIQDKIIYKYYKKIVKSKDGKIIHKKGDVMSVEVKKKHNDLTKLVKLLIFLDTENLEQYKEKKWYYLILQYKDSKHWEYILRLSKMMYNHRVWKVKEIEFTTGTFRYNLKGNEFIIDETNSKFKYWFNFKGVKYPLSINKDYHDIEKLRTSKNKQVTIKVNEFKKKVDFVFSRENIDPVFKEQFKSVGIDINVKDNFCAISDEKIFDYDRKLIKKLIEAIKKLDKIGTQNFSKKQKRKLEKLVLANEFYFKQLIFEILNYLESQNITDIVLEDLNTATFAASFIKNPEFEIKYSRIIRVLRLGNVKEWFNSQAEKRGIRVHLTNPAYSSQTCPDPNCGYTDRANRPSVETFCCIVCGYTNNSHIVSAINLNRRLVVDVLKTNLHNLDKFGRMTPKPMKKEKVKELLSSFSLLPTS
jgi:hypothetical protein